MTGGTCYMCDLPETSSEHVPPKCFFPEQKDLGKDYRKNLLSVPSCNLHNSEKSKDDEYLRFVITSHYDNKPVAQKQFSTKIMRSVKRKPSMFGFVTNNYPILVNGQPSIAYSVDRDRFDKEIDHIARALYFFHHQSRLTLPLIVHTPDLFTVNRLDADNINQRMQKIEEMTVDALFNESKHGDNPDIFSYQFRDIEETSSFFVRMLFYGGFVAIVYASPSVKPVLP